MNRKRPSGRAVHARLASIGAAFALAGCGGVVEQPSGAHGAGGTAGAAEHGGTSAAGGQPSAAGGTADAGVDDSPRSCRGLANNCGRQSSDSCCESPLVEGGTFFRSYDNVNAGYTSQAYPATVKAFRLDKYEITVGRFRKFVADYSPDMIPAGAGKNPSNSKDQGWDTTWNTSLVTDRTALSFALECDDSYQTWTQSPGANENKPINCLSWFEAFAFCIWDGGRLPTEAEWNYAAAGGNEQRVYPWGSAPPDDSLAVFCGASCSSAENVGSKSPSGDGKWGQTDLAGNVYEWVLDWLERPYPQASCNNCANTAVTTGRAFRGGAFSSDAMGLLVSARSGGGQGDHGGGTGTRCARAP